MGHQLRTDKTVGNDKMFHLLFHVRRHLHSSPAPETPCASRGVLPVVKTLLKCLVDKRYIFFSTPQFASTIIHHCEFFYLSVNFIFIVNSGISIWLCLLYLIIFLQYFTINTPSPTSE